MLEGDTSAQVCINIGFAQVDRQVLVQLRPGVEALQRTFRSVRQIQHHSLDAPIRVKMLKD
ncbi:hypothetical protein D3C77_597720 [compost metagenome]